MSEQSRSEKARAVGHALALLANRDKQDIERRLAGNLDEIAKAAEMLGPAFDRAELVAVTDCAAVHPLPFGEGIETKTLRVLVAPEKTRQGSFRAYLVVVPVALGLSGS